MVVGIRGRPLVSGDASFSRSNQALSSHQRHVSFPERDLKSRGAMPGKVKIKGLDSRTLKQRKIAKTIWF